MTVADVCLSEFKVKASQMLAAMKATKGVIVVTQTGSARAVVQDCESHQRLRESSLMLKLVVQGEADISARRTTPQGKVFADIKAGLAASDE